MELYRSNACALCQECKDRLLNLKEPTVPSHKTVIAVVGVLVAAFVVLLCSTAIGVWNRPEQGVFLHALAWVAFALEILVYLVVGVVGIVLSVYFLVVNVKGVPVVYLYDKHQQVHVHRVGDPLNPAEWPVVVHGRIGGWFRRSRLVKGGVDGTVRTWDGVHMTVVDKTGAVRMDIASGMRFLAESTLLRNAVEVHASLCDMAVDVQALHDVAEDRQSPFGQSKYGALVYNRFTSHLVTLPTWLQRRIGPAAAKIANELKTDERRRNSA